MGKGISNKYRTAFIHAGCLLMLFGTPVLFNNFYLSGTLAGMVRDWLPLVSFTVVFYVNYLFLIDKYFFTKKNVQFVVSNIIMFTAMIFVMNLAHEFVWKNLDQNPDQLHQRPSEFYIFYIQFFSFAISSIVSIAVKSVQRNNQIEKEKKDIERIHLETELNQLKQQINPHFLFNTLNNIYSLIAKDQTKAQESVHMLSHMMRYVLYESQSDFLPISKEIAFIKNYINLMKLRLANNAKLEVNIKECSKDYLISPLILITFVENAFKHSAGITKDSFISIKIDFDNSTLLYSTINSIGVEQKLEGNNSGVGLVNLQKRLSLLYGNNYSLSTYAKENVFYSDLELKLKG